MMHGLLWFDNDPKTSLTQKIQAALGVNVFVSSLGKDNQ